MGAVETIVFVFTLSSMALWYFWRLGLSPSKPWGRVAKELNLGYSFDPKGGNELAGMVGDVYLRVTERPDGAETEFRAESRDIPRDLFLRSEGFFEQGIDLQIHDEDFDEKVRVRGDQRVVFALLSHENRSRLADFVVNRRGEIEYGVVQFSVIGGVFRTATMRSLIREVLDVARRLALPLNDIPERLAANATGKDRVVIRLKNLELLQRHFYAEEIAREASLKALKDRRSAIRLQGAIFLRKLEMIAKIAAVEAEPIETRIDAIRFLIEEAPSDEVTPLLEELLSSLSPAVRKEAIAGLGELRHHPAVGKLCSLAATADPETAKVLAKALVKMGDAAAEPALLHLLERDDNDVQLTAAKALGQIGTASAVEPLMGLTKSLLGSQLERAAREAIARIQSRLGDVEAGRLALAELTEHEGALSFSREGGELSLPEADPSDTEDSS